TEAISLLTQNETAHRGIELDGLSERPECAEERHIRLLLLFTLGGGFGQRIGAKWCGVDQRVSRGRQRLGNRGSRFNYRLRLRSLLIYRVHFLRTQPMGLVLRQR